MGIIQKIMSVSCQFCLHPEVVISLLRERMDICSIVLRAVLRVTMKVSTPYLVIDNFYVILSKNKLRPLLLYFK
jgi:hypothetical protein